MITNRCLWQNNSARVRVRKIPAKQVLIKCISDFHLIVNDYTAHFATNRSFLNILCCRVSPKLSIGTNIVFVGSISEVMLSRIDYLSVISFWCYSNIYFRCWYFTKMYSQCVGNMLHVIMREKNVWIGKLFISFYHLKVWHDGHFSTWKLSSLKRGCFHGFLNIIKTKAV